jgi:hypothetical protein
MCTSADLRSRGPAVSRFGGERVKLRQPVGAVPRFFKGRALRVGVFLAASICLTWTLALTGCATTLPPAEPTQTAFPSSTTSPSLIEATESPGPSFPYPAAMLIFDPSTGGLNLVSQDGVELGGLGRITWSDPDRLRGTTLGSIEGEFGRVRFAYLTAGDSGLDLNVRSSIGTVTLGEYPMDSLLAGSVPAGLVVVSDPGVAGSDEQAGSDIYVVDPARRSGLDAPAVRGLPAGAVPLVLQTEDGQPSSIVYCLSPSQDLTVEDDPCYGLYRVEIVSGQVDQIVSANLVIMALSSDLRIAALASKDRTPPEVRVRDLESGLEIVFRSEAGEREVHQGAFSPAGTRLAWPSFSREEGGQDTLALNLVSASGGPVTRLADATLSEAVGEQVSDARVVGWLDDSRLLLELTTPWRSALYVLLLEEGRIDHVASGRLAGLIYR